MKKILIISTLVAGILGVSKIKSDAPPPVLAQPVAALEVSKADRGLQNCPDRFLGSKAPSLPEALDRQATTLCYTAFASRSSPITRTPVWAAEKLTPDSVRSARSIERVSNFYAEDRLHDHERAELGDYSKSGWDRGHLAPSGDMPTLDAQAESFSLANIIPQSGYLNRNSWADLESDVRNLANRRDVLYVVTGTLYEGATVQTMPSGRVIIPTSLWKAVAAPGEGAVVFVANNNDQPGWAKVTVADFHNATGIDPFPALAMEDRQRLLQVGTR